MPTFHWIVLFLDGDDQDQQISSLRRCFDEFETRVSFYGYFLTHLADW